MSNVLVGVVIRKSRKVVRDFKLTKEGINELLVDHFCNDVSKAMEAWDTLREGNTFKLKLNGFTVTLQPLHNHIDHY